ncbi:dentin sialophosphoprotein isoform X2 [Atheta coriaria]|uniref:dentin sialophosphoprotein isoform X2 n=1 Tax=Dalotia coriaria TaxID=877792 RepID=UPI0031F3DE5D
MWIVAVSICGAITLVVVLALCSCWKRQEQKDDWLGLDGMVKQKNPDENVNHIPLSSAAPAVAVSLHVAAECTANVTSDVEQTTLEASKRPTVQTNNTRRSLPDIPSEGHALQGQVWDANGDNSSELYATVEPYNNIGGKRHTLPNGLDARASISQHSSISQADDAFSPYASVNYDKLQQVEHPYAIVKPPTTNNEENAAEPTVRTSLLSAEASTSNEPHAPPRSRRTSEQSIHIDINAASAVAGGIAANQDLPYMTPPINPSNQQVNFSGDSQDSSKGYTSISVREPLANIIAQTKDMNKVKRALDPHYSTVSDDSDEMYTTIPDALNQEYTSGSETYAQIQPVALTVAAEIYPVSSNQQSSPSETQQVNNVDDSAPQPPSVDILKNMTNSHSRQASSTSSILNLGSPKPEKRQANSPLPPPPSTTSASQLTLSPDNARRNLDDMYAKVQKNRKKSSDDVIKRKSTSSNSSSEEKRPEDTKLLREHNYETLKKSPKKNADGYEELKTKPSQLSEPGYASINGPDSLNYDDPNYEQLKDRSTTPGYSTITSKSSSETSELGYSVINKLNKKKLIDEPNYESMPASETDPNYESVQHNDPNYESVKYLDVDIGYERLQQTDDDDSTATTTTTNKTDNKNGYETVDSAASSNKSKSPPYEKLNDDDGKTDSESSGYERIDKSSSIEEKSKNDDYETIKNDLNDCLGDENAIFEV